MNCRRHGRKPTIGLWMLVAVADLGILVAATSALTVLLVLAGLVVLAGGVFAARSMLRRTDATPAVVRATQTVTRRRV